MATRQFSDLTPYRRAVSNAQAGSNLLDSLIQGVQGGIQLQQLPGKIQGDQLAQQLQNAINLQKLRDLQNPQAALARRLEEELTLKGALNPDLGIQRAAPGLVGETIFNPGALTPEQQASLTISPSVIPTAAAGLPETPISAFGIQTGLNSNPNIPAQAAQDKLERQIAALNARPVNMVLTKEGLAFNPREGTASDVFINDQSVSNQRRTNVEADAKSKADAAQALADSKGVQAKELQEDKQNFTAQENEKNRQNRVTLADKRAKIASDVPVAASAYQAERQGRVLASVDDLEKDVGYDTVGFADWFKGVPTTEAKSFAGRLKTLKAAIAFGELTSMREASKTGGALGQVSNIELGLLESALGNLDQAQSPSDFKEELGKIRDSIKRWQAASAKAPSGAQPPPAGSSAVERLRQKHQVQ